MKESFPRGTPSRKILTSHSMPPHISLLSERHMTERALVWLELEVEFSQMTMPRTTLGENFIAVRTGKHRNSVPLYFYWAWRVVMWP